MGITSIIAILVILVLVVFSTLSLITAKADLTLSEKTAENIQAYYNADNSAELIIADFGDVIGSGETINDEDFSRYSGVFTKGKDYSYASAGRLFKFNVTIDDSRELKVEVTYDDNGKINETLLWQVSPTKEWTADNKVELFQP